MFTPFAIYAKQAGAPPTPSIDPDAQAFFNAVTGGGDTLTATEESAVNQLVLDLKADSIWSELQAIYPFVGGTATAHKWNLKDPQDTNGAYRISFNGSWTHNSSGITGDRSSTYAETYYAVNTNNTASVGISMGVYTNGGTNASGYDLGAFEDPAGATGQQDIMITAGYGNNTFYVNFQDLSYATYATTCPDGFWHGDHINGVTKGYEDGSQVINTSQADYYGEVSRTLWIGGSNRGGGASEPTDRTYAFAFIGKSLQSGTLAADLYTAVQAFETTLSRNN